MPTESLVCIAPFRSLPFPPGVLPTLTRRAPNRHSLFLTGYGPCPKYQVSRNTNTIVLSNPSPLTFTVPYLHTFLCAQSLQENLNFIIRIRISICVTITTFNCHSTTSFTLTVIIHVCTSFTH